MSSVSNFIMSDTDDSVLSARSTASSRGPNEDLTLVAEFDELMKILNQQRNDRDSTEEEFIHLIQQVQLMNKEWIKSVDECVRLQGMVDDVTHNYRDLECKLGMSRKLFDRERKRTKLVQEERDHLRIKLEKIEKLILSNNYRNSIPHEIQEQFASLHTNNVQPGYDFSSHNVEPHLSIIQEGNTTGSLLSNFSYSRSEDDLDVSLLNNGRTWKKHRPSMECSEEPALKKRRSSTTKTVEINPTDTVRATTTLTVPKGGPITATSIIESIPNEPPNQAKHTDRHVLDGLQPSAPPEHLVFDLWQRNSPSTNNFANVRQHIFQTKTVVMPENCGVCKKRISFGKQAVKCKQCRNICHSECRDNLSLPCVPVVNTPTQRGVTATIADYTPTTPPMVPALIIHCLNQIESRGLHELGIYRVPGSDREVQSLKEKFLHSKIAPNLDQIDIHVICGTVKSFLRSLSESLVTQMRWNDFIRAVESTDANDIAPILYQIILKLPQPNRDTLAYMLLHLKKIAESPHCKMPASNLSKVFGPTLIGYSSSDVQSNVALITETRQITTVMEHLIGLPVDFWSSFLNYESTLKTPNSKLQQTPSTDSLLCQTTRRGFFTHYGSRSTNKTKQKIFPTPKSFK